MPFRDGLDRSVAGLLIAVEADMLQQRWCHDGGETIVFQRKRPHIRLHIGELGRGNIPIHMRWLIEIYTGDGETVLTQNSREKGVSRKAKVEQSMALDMLNEPWVVRPPLMLPVQDELVIRRDGVLNNSRVHSRHSSPLVQRSPAFGGNCGGDRNRPVGSSATRKQVGGRVGE